MHFSDDISDKKIPEKTIAPFYRGHFDIIHHNL